MKLDAAFLGIDSNVRLSFGTTAEKYQEEGGAAVSLLLLKVEALHGTLLTIICCGIRTEALFLGVARSVCVGMALVLLTVSILTLVPPHLIITFALVSYPNS